MVNALNRFMGSRSDVDFSSLTDQEIYDSWIMTFDAMMPMFRMLYEYRCTFSLLIDKAAGTRYENFSHEYVTKMSYAYEQFYAEARKRGLAQAEVTREEFHALISSFWTCICEPIVHDMTWEQIEAHCHIVCRFCFSHTLRLHKNTYFTASSNAKSDLDVLAVM